MCDRFGGLVGYILLSVALGRVSIVLFPRKFAAPIWLQIANIVVSPIIVGVAKVWVGDGGRREVSKQSFSTSVVWTRFRAGFCGGAVYGCSIGGLGWY